MDLAIQNWYNTRQHVASYVQKGECVLYCSLQAILYEGNTVSHSTKLCCLAQGVAKIKCSKYFNYIHEWCPYAVLGW